MPRYMTTAEVAALFRTSPETLRFWRYVGKGPQYFKVGRRVLYDVTVVEEYLAAHQNATQGAA
jgi:hypothetical protein